MAKAKKSKKKKQKKSNLDVAVVVMIVISILLAVLIYAESGYIGEHLSPMLGGLFWIYKVHNSSWNVRNRDIFSI